MTQRLLTRLLLGFALVSIGFAAGTHVARSGDKASSAGDGSAGPSGNPQGVAVIVYYMHATFRCVTCNTIESMTRSLLESEFKAEMQSGAVRMKEINFQENEALARRYNVAASCVVVSRKREGEEVAFKRLDEVWELMKDPPAFNRYVGGVVRDYLAKKGTE